MITHQMEVARDACDYVAVLDGGKVVEQGTVTEIFTKPQSEVTKDFLANLKPPTEDENLSSQKDVKLVRWSQTRGKYLLRFVGALTDEPVLSNMLKKIDVEVNIRAGGIQHLSTGNVGTLAADITGSPENVAAAINYLGSMGITVEE